MNGQLKYGFHKKYFRKSETLTSWTLFSPVFFQINADWLKLHWKANLVMDFFVKINFQPISSDLEKNGGKKCSTRQSFIFSEVLLMKSIFYTSFNTIKLMIGATLAWLYCESLVNCDLFIRFPLYRKYEWHLQRIGASSLNNASLLHSAS